MKKLRKNLFLGTIIIIASITGYFLQEKEQRSYVLEMESHAGETFPAVKPTNNTITNDLYSSTTSSEDTPEKTTQGKKININTATKEELETLVGIGKVKAGQIIAYRESNGPFEVIEDIMKVSGIGKKTFEKFKNNITIN